MTRTLHVARSMLGATGLGLLALLALWAFVSYLQPAFSGEVAADLLRCN
jgi:hypothetical protein